MNNNPTALATNEDRTIVIHNIAIPPTVRGEMLAIDVERAWKYYPQYFRHAQRTGKIPMLPASYIMEVIRQMFHHDDRNKASAEFARYLGREFFDDLEKFHQLHQENIPSQTPQCPITHT